MKSLENAGEPYSCQIFQSGKTLEYEVEDGQFFDLLFLDIELGGEDGFVLAEHLQGRLPAALLIFVSSHEKYACIVKTDGSQSRVRRTLKSLAQELPEDIFLQIDRGYLCNVAKVTQLKKDKLTLATGEEFYVSSGRLRELKDKVMEYWIREKKI